MISMIGLVWFIYETQFIDFFIYYCQFLSKLYTKTDKTLPRYISMDVYSAFIYTYILTLHDICGCYTSAYTRTY